jgi:hypothetical protein
MAWLLAIEVKGVTEYWTGRQGPNGGPQRTLWKADAFHFPTAEAAYVCADTHQGLKNSEEWKVVPR